MTPRAVVIADPALAEYDFGPGHPLAPIRVQLALRLADDLGLLAPPTTRVIGEVAPAAASQLLAVHEPDYIDAVREAGRTGDPGRAAYGLGTVDVPVFPGMHTSAARVAGASIRAADEVLAGRSEHAVNLFGGLHHAMPGRAAGFCVYNDAGVAIRWLLDQGVQRVAYVDVDAHHGDGVQAMFYNDPRVPTISLHESGSTLFPGTGFPGDIGGPAAKGHAVNVALPAGTGDGRWLRAFHAIVPRLLAQFQPKVLVSQHGCDSHASDPLTHLSLSIDGQRASYSAIHRLAHRLASGRWVALGGGGYEIVDVVPRAWAHLVGEACHEPVPPRTPIPESFAGYVMRRLGRIAPTTMTEGGDPWSKPYEEGADFADPVDRAISATQEAVFPHWGLPVDHQDAF